MSAASDCRRIGMILAAGRGRRMGGGKQLKLWPCADGPKPLVCAAYDAIRPICDEMVVVVGHAADTVASALGERVFRRVESDPDAAMFESIRAGLIEARRMDPSATVVLQPGDHPEVATSALAVLCDTSLERATQAVIPEHQGKGGHPVLIPPTIISQILADDCPNGLGQFWLDNPSLCVRVAVNDPTMLRDIDTPADFPQ